jgi:FkbM family methyltransferase
MKLKEVLLYVLRNPSRWIPACKIAIGVLLGRREIKVRSDGVTLKCGAKSGEGVWCALAGLSYEPELKLFLDRLEINDVVIDLGANIGAYSIRAAQKIGPSGHVFAFEPLERTRIRLEEAVVINRVGNITIVPVAAGDREGRISLAIDGRGSSAKITEASGGSAFQMADMTTIDAFTRSMRIKRLDWVKMDIEGAEPLAVGGMLETITTFRPNFLFENESGGVATAQLLTNLGYVIGSFAADGSFIETSLGGNLFALPQEALSPPRQ